MQRRKFFKSLSYGAAGLGLATSCKPLNNDDHTSGADAGELHSSSAAPAYRKQVNTSFGSGPVKSANDTVILAIIGVGGYGNLLVQETLKLDKNIQFKYICDVDDTRGGKAMMDIDKSQGPKVVRVKDMRRVFDDKEVDAVLIVTPQHWHALATIRACQSGKDVYVEKCISHNIFEGQKMIEAAAKYNRIVQCGTQNRSAAYAQSARLYIESGELGELVAVHMKEMTNGPIPFNEKPESNKPDSINWDLWLGPAPEVPYSISRNKSWGFYWDYAGGYAMGNGIIHQADLVRYVLGNPGFPVAVSCAGGRYFFDDKRDVPDYQMATLNFGDYVMTMEAGQCTPYMDKTSPEIRYGDGFPQWGQNSTDIQILGTQRMMHLGVMGGGFQVFDKGGEIVVQESGIFPLRSHLENFIDSVRSRKKPNADIVEGHKSAVLVHLANIAYRTGNQHIIFSPETESILNDNSAQSMISRDYRKGFEVPSEI